ncbi:zinc finger protein Xfin [Thalassophryne amazonica]|uniref:zinc finger protein Xfin n=1 Tax=Thalassophryne amazonica TaxID=390379 RepID=UPI001470B501|nr:zinc finger protein Xfin [Thalassophryne amazonica]
MDEAVVAGSREDGDENLPAAGDQELRNNDGTTEEKTEDGVGIFCCQECGATFSVEAAFLEHRQQHPKESFIVDLNEHSGGLSAPEKDDRRTHFCVSCSLSFVDSRELHAHMEKNHGRLSPKESAVQMDSGLRKQHTYECSECGKSYAVFGHFLNHQRSHKQASQSFFCDLEHLKKKQFQCESCGRNYSRASALDAHRRCHEEKLVKSRNRNSGHVLHTEESPAESIQSENQINCTPGKRFMCLCGKDFATLPRLKTHQRFSRNCQCSPEEKDKEKTKKIIEFCCSECEKSFSSQTALLSHQRWHTDRVVKRFPCEECGKLFMTLAFCYRHQRMAHGETPVKSFLHQVCQLQKKSFECEDCGLKFSRASALHSHQLCHTDVFRETEKETKKPAGMLPQQKAAHRKSENTESSEAEVILASMPPAKAEEDSCVTDSDVDMDSYEPGDFNVQVISASESEDESLRDQNPDLELLCESDQDLRLNAEKPEMDLKIVQIDFEQAEDQSALMAKDEHKLTTERHDCPDCDRWFSSASSLRAHRMWHERRKNTHDQPLVLNSCDICTHKTSSPAAHCTHILKNTDDNSGRSLSKVQEAERESLKHSSQCPGCMKSFSHAADLIKHKKICSEQKRDNVSQTKKAFNPKKSLLGPKIYHCEQCGKGFWSLGAYSHHKQDQNQCADLRQRKGFTASSHPSGRSRSALKVACPVCGRHFRHRGTMKLHMRKHENVSHKCDVCNKSFRLYSGLLKHKDVHIEHLLPPPIKSFQHQVEQLQKNTYSCANCGKLFSRAKALQFHMKSHGCETEDLPSSPKSAVTLDDFQCAKCNAHLNNKSALRAHHKVCIKRDSTTTDCVKGRSQNQKKCLKGNGDASTGGTSEEAVVDSEIKYEVGTGEVKQENQMALCNLKSPSVDSLKYKCKQCDRSFSVIGALNFHKRIHVEDHVDHVSVTTSKLPQTTILKNSKQEKVGKGLFHCLDCGRCFMSNSALGSHKRWHADKKRLLSSRKENDVKSVSPKTEAGPFHCNKCGKQFFHQYVLQRHQTYNPKCQNKTDLELVSDQSSTLKNVEFTCPECNKTFALGSHLAVHYEDEHGNTAESVDLQGDELQLASVQDPDEAVLVRGRSDRDIDQTDGCFGQTDQVPDQTDGCHRESNTISSETKIHQCPFCSMTFTKVRGLRAHKWQVHSMSTTGKNKVSLTTTDFITSTGEVNKQEDLSPEEAAAVSKTGAKENSAVGRGSMETASQLPLVKLVSHLDCGERCTSPNALDHKETRQESQHDAKTSESMVVIPPPLGHLSEYVVRCLFKCDNCGKAFQTEEQLGTHKSKAKSWPHCCTLCCLGFWTETQLQQHLAWHDEVRYRLPNELRYRLSAAMTSKLKANVHSADKGKSFPSSTYNQAVLNTDGQSQSNQCQHCDKTFLSLTALQKHEAQHTNSDSYRCSLCPRTFSEIQDLIDHHQECIGDYKHQSDTPAAVLSRDTNNLTCHECGMTFCQETALHQHYVEHAHGVW